MNQKERAINLGLKINSLKGNFSVAQSVIQGLEKEIKDALIDENDRKSLLSLYEKIVTELRSFVSPELTQNNIYHEMVEELLKEINKTSTYIEADNIEGSIISFENRVAKDKIITKEQKAILKSRLEGVREKHRGKVGFYLKRNFDRLLKEIKNESDNDNPFHVSIVVKKYNEIVKTTPLISDDRHFIQALLDTTWQKSASDIKIIKQLEREEDD